MYVTEVIVVRRKDKIPCLCMKALVGGLMVYKCGACGCGNILAKRGFCCKVCRARVIEVREVDDRFRSEIMDIKDLG